MLVACAILQLYRPESYAPMHAIPSCICLHREIGTLAEPLNPTRVVHAKISPSSPSGGGAVARTSPL